MAIIVPLLLSCNESKSSFQLDSSCCKDNDSCQLYKIRVVLDFIFDWKNTLVQNQNQIESKC